MGFGFHGHGHAQAGPVQLPACTWYLPVRVVLGRQPASPGSAPAKTPRMEGEEPSSLAVGHLVSIGTQNCWQIGEDLKDKLVH